MLPSETEVARGVGIMGPPGVGVQVGGRIKPWVTAMATTWGGNVGRPSRGIKRKMMRHTKRQADTRAANKNHPSAVRGLRGLSC
jgi:hypothetical protein